MSPRVASDSSTLRPAIATGLGWLLIAGVFAVDLATGPAALAQPGGGGAGGFSGAPGGMGEAGEDAKHEGIAEAAPKTGGALPSNAVLPPSRSNRKRWKLFELDGYFRLRTDWYKNFALGFTDAPGLGGAPFPRALGCNDTSSATSCQDSVSGTNMRLRLEPTFNIDEGTAVHVQADVLDNVVMGSTPDDPSLPGSASGTAPPAGAFGEDQTTPVAGSNDARDAIQVKRVWAEVALPLGILTFGRMPNQWGMGMTYNGGGEDAINGGYNQDADSGDSVDRVSFSTIIPGSGGLRAQIATDWLATRLVSSQTSVDAGRSDHPFDLDDTDDANQWVLTISKLDTPTEFRDTIDRGEMALNWGVYFGYKTQDNDANLTGFTPGTDLADGQLVTRNYKAYAPDLWGKLGIGQVLFEAEIGGEFGTIDRLADYGITSAVDIRKLGGIGRMTWTGLERKLRLGLETGFATGDQWDNVQPGQVHISHAAALGGPGDTTLTQFAFDRNYQVDLILFHRLLGAVTNAVYAKPFLAYDVTRSITFKVSNVESFAAKPIATPGNSTMYGVEFDSDLSYTNGNFQIGASYGVLFPLGAMDHPADDADQRGNGYGFSGSNVGTAGNAHTILTRIALGF